MATFKVHVSQYVEETAVLEVEADTVEAARALAEITLTEGEIDWEDGTDCFPATIQRVDNDNNDTLWEAGDDDRPDRPRVGSKLLLEE